ncbi:hypothetical protein ARAM_007215 [Aspergillus rambellii]|uniref:Chromatin assembly factor 1 subunit A n=1 Tax=Aspergillus rambellii TaxID=308745 RepID=A0A0F8XGQ6_9EURO|nr:hypothetical protein ARAM_007215 [Aspergillus rambellii]
MQDAPVSLDHVVASTPASVYSDDKENVDSTGEKLVETTTAAMSAAVVVGGGGGGVDQSQTHPQMQMPPAAKKRKVSPASREARQQEKEAKEKLKLEERAKKDEEKKAKEEEKRKRDAEKEEEKKKREAGKEEERKRKEEKRKVKEEEKAAKEEEKRKKEEEKMKKERAQTRLNAFFMKPKPTIIEHPVSSAGGSPKKSSGGDASAEPLEVSVKASDYRQEFPEFFLKSHTSVAPPHRFERDPQALAHMQVKVDACLKPDSKSCDPPVFRPSELFRMMSYKRRQGRTASVKDLLLQMQSLSEQSETPELAQKLQNSLKQVRMKSLKFGEDVRPSYQGTFSKPLSEGTAYRLMRNPFRRELPNTNYDYDSEAEWEEPEEGEDLDSEEEEEGSEEGDDDMDGFLDDEDDQLADGKRRLLVGDLEPSCTGIRWQDQGIDPDLQIYKIETISPAVTFPIDPFSTAYWAKPKAPEPTQTATLSRSTLDAFVGGPSTQASAGLPAPDAGAGRPKRGFPMEQLAEFKQVVEGSDLTKAGLIEILKKRFPKVPKDALKDMLNTVASRVGQKEAEKKWVCK